MRDTVNLSEVNLAVKYHLFDLGSIHIVTNNVYH